MKPIIFNTEMVRAILDGRKTETRRPLKPGNKFKASGWSQYGDGLWVNGYGNNEAPGKIKDYSYCTCWYDINHWLEHFHGKHGDTLYVRETFQESECFDNNIKGLYAYRANEADEEHASEYGVKWKPSIYMPKKAARVFLKITNVRLERLKDIDGKSVLAEGVDNGHSNPTMGERWENMQKMSFYDLWDSIYKDEYPSASNPWVVVYEFELMSNH